MGVNLCRSRCVALGDLATVMRAESPRCGSSVRTWSVWVHFRSYRAFDLCLAARSVYGPIGCHTIGTTSPIRSRMDYLPPVDRIGICFQYPPVEPVPALVRRSSFVRFTSAITEVHRKGFPQAARQLDEFGIVCRYGYHDTFGHHLPWRHIKARGQCAAVLDGYFWCPTG